MEKILIVLNALLVDELTVINRIMIDMFFVSSFQEVSKNVSNPTYIYKKLELFQAGKCCMQKRKPLIKM
ncbi:MAG: hypothetical protein M0P26_00475 [Bacteroidales bacterium]|nr:hypothetical protein [Bacteroidales bacterium]